MLKKIYLLKFMRLCIFASLIFLLGCATYQDNVHPSRKMLERGQIEESLNRLKKYAEEVNDDQLVYLLDYGVALQIAGRYKESNDVLLKADKLAEVQDYHSVSRVAGSIITAEEMVQYKGESYEKVLINAYLAINFLMLNQLDEALVEVRRLNEKLNLYRIEGGKNYELNSFAKYLSAIIWEAESRYDDAYIAYEETYNIDGRQGILREDLIRTSKLSRREDMYKKWKAEFDSIKEGTDWYDKKKGELIVVFQQGWAPRKYPDPQSPRFPYLRSVYSGTQEIEIVIDGERTQSRKFFYNVGDVAKKVFAEDYGALVGRRLGGFVAKEIVADQVRQRDDALGFLAWILLHITDRADLRQWSTLPNSLQIVRLRLNPGTYKIILQGIGYDGEQTPDQSTEFEVTIASGKKSFLNYRTFR